MITPDTKDTEQLAPQLILMSIKPCYWHRIASGEKRFELRRTSVRFAPGDFVLVYASAPSKALVGGFEVERVHRATVTEIWNRFRKDLGVKRSDYAAYFRDAPQATAIEIAHVTQFDHVSLRELRERLPEFRPPQSFMYWPREHMERLQLEPPALRGTGTQCELWATP